MSRDISSPESAERLCNTLRWIIAAAGLVLIAQTRRLWFGSAEIFPQVPLVSWFLGSPEWCDDFLSGLMVGSSAALLFCFRGNKLSTIATFAFTGTFPAAVLLNQHRLQPWAYEFCILLLVMAILPPAKAVPCLRLFVASIYLHSGLSKLDVTFLSTHGEAFVSVVTTAIGWDFASAPVGVRRALAALLPLGEILVAVGLLIPKTRWFAKWASVVMHLGLLWILGPWGLGHKPGVLIWNAYFILQNLVLFQAGPRAASETPSGGRAWQWRAGYGFVATVALLPLLEPVGYFDHWPAWAVYASRPERVRIYVAEDRISDLPSEVQKFEDDDPPADAVERFFAGKPALKRIRIDHWSLEVLRAPIYPEDRFQIGVALALAERFGLGENVRVEIDSAADRWTGKRSKVILEGEEAIREAAGQFLFNAEPR